jgi:DNA invertase Pin-like site-specific DNA recombinase
MPYNVLTPELRNQIWLMYLRKSRQDDPNESVAEVLAKHEQILQEWARRELGREIPEDCIYREIVSGGESIEEREEMRKVLARIEDVRVAGCLVVDCQRLTRGSLEDCGLLITTLKLTSTLVATPMMTYDMNNKMERKFFEGELMRGREFLDYSKEILLRGRIAAIKRGCYIATHALYGYRKVVIGKDHTLEPDENADIVRMIFDDYVNQDMTYYQIACKLDDMGVKPQKGEKWNKTSIRWILKNVHYDGKVCFNRVREVASIENGERITRRVNQPQEEVIIAEGKHQALVDHETFIKAQEKLNANPPAKQGYPLKNPFAGIMYCAKCGKAIAQHPYKHAEDRLECRTRPRCYKSVKMSEVEQAVIVALEQAELPNLQAKWKSGEGNSIAIQKKLLESLEKEMVNYRQQEERQYEFLETGRYTPDVFDKRNAVLRQKMEDCQERIYKAKATMPKEVNYAEKIVTLKEAIAGMKNPDYTPEQKNRLLKAIVKRIELKTENVGHNAVDIHLSITLRL